MFVSLSCRHRNFTILKVHYVHRGLIPEILMMFLLGFGNFLITSGANKIYADSLHGKLENSFTSFRRRVGINNRGHFNKLCHNILRRSSLGELVHWTSGNLHKEEGRAKPQFIFARLFKGMGKVGSISYQEIMEGKIKWEYYYGSKSTEDYFKHDRMFVRVTFNGNLFHPAEGLFRKVFVDLLRSYCLGQDRSIQAFARMEIFYYCAITVAPFFR